MKFTSPSLFLLLAAGCLAMCARPIWARQHSPATDGGSGGSTSRADGATKGKGETPNQTSASVVSRHEVMIEGTLVKYTASTGYMTLPDYDGKPKANVFYVAYTRDAEPQPPAPSPAIDAPPPRPPGGEAAAQPSVEAAAPAPMDPATRPITFAFNGGPGSSSVWLHMGALGPRRVVMEPEGWAPPPPYSMVDNEHSWLDVTDLVFIDPVSTGYSRPVDGEAASQFHGLQEDIRSVGDFIRLYTTRNKRWASPKFLAGESYGTTRAAGLAGYLQETHGMYLNGIVLVSTVLNFQTVRFDSGNDLPYVLFLPTYTATAWYHKKLEAALQADLRKTLDEVEAWALGEYHLALAHGSDLTGEQRKRIAARLASYTGLSEQFVENSNLRIEISNFCKELLRDRDLTVGRLDSRFTGVDADSVGSRPEYDPSMAAISGPYTACLNDYVRRELNYENDLPYEILTGRVNPWSYSTANNRYVNVAETLRQAMTRNRDLKVLVACGYYDLATPFFAAEYTMSHLGLPPDLLASVRTVHYEAGHMMYIRQVDLAGLKQHAAEFIGAGARK